LVCEPAAINVSQIVPSAIGEEYVPLKIQSTCRIYIYLPRVCWLSSVGLAAKGRLTLSVFVVSLPKVIVSLKVKVKRANSCPSDLALFCCCTYGKDLRIEIFNCSLTKKLYRENHRYQRLKILF